MVKLRRVQDHRRSKHKCCHKGFVFHFAALKLAWLVRLMINGLFADGFNTLRCEAWDHFDRLFRVELSHKVHRGAADFLFCFKFFILFVITFLVPVVDGVGQQLLFCVCELSRMFDWSDDCGVVKRAFDRLATHLNEHDSANRLLLASVVRHDRSLLARFCFRRIGYAFWRITGNISYFAVVVTNFWRSLLLNLLHGLNFQDLCRRSFISRVITLLLGLEGG